MQVFSIYCRPRVTQIKLRNLLSKTDMKGTDKISMIRSRDARLKKSIRFRVQVNELNYHLSVQNKKHN